MRDTVTGLMPLHIRVACLADVPQLTELLNQLFSHEKEFTPDSDKQARGLGLIVQNPEIGKILVASTDGHRIYAMVNLLYTVSTFHGNRVCILEDMIVSERCRSCGVGSRLLNAAIGLAKRDGCSRITLLTDGSNEGAHRFYNRHGFAISSMIPMRRTLA